jgi:hypothetical protein
MFPKTLFRSFIGRALLGRATALNQDLERQGRGCARDNQRRASSAAYASSYSHAWASSSLVAAYSSPSCALTISCALHVVISLGFCLHQRLHLIPNGHYSRLTSALSLDHKDHLYALQACFLKTVEALPSKIFSTTWATCHLRVEGVPHRPRRSAGGHP